MSTQDCLIDINYTEKNIEFLINTRLYICSYAKENTYHFIYMTPGIGIDKKR